MRPHSLIVCLAMLAITSIVIGCAMAARAVSAAPGSPSHLTATWDASYAVVAWQQSSDANRFVIGKCRVNDGCPIVHSDDGQAGVHRIPLGDVLPGDAFMVCEYRDSEGVTEVLGCAGPVAVLYREQLPVVRR
jgi:hypothetical protein